MREDKELLEYIKENLEDEYIIKKVAVTFVPSVKQLFRVLKQNGIFIDTQDKDLKGVIRKAYQLKNEEGFNQLERLAYFSLGAVISTINNHEDRLNTLESSPRVGGRLACEDLSFGEGTIMSLFSGNKMLVNFDNSILNIMCDSNQLITIHDNKKRKLKLL